jgi:hypothetical protein
VSAYDPSRLVAVPPLNDDILTAAAKVIGQQLVRWPGIDGCEALRLPDQDGTGQRPTLPVEQSSAFHQLHDDPSLSVLGEETARGISENRHRSS